MVPSLRNFEDSANLTLEALAVLGETDTSTVWRIERDFVEPSRHTIVLLARGLGISAERMQRTVAADRASHSMTPGSNPLSMSR